ncbi:MAG TPA: hypothetical protein VHU77_09975 [Candidatus Limnocylindria bacterium]|jgi:hypothetical protein|nr:hypothetical protein [Candidatus Limnocylindria bacterium]
METIRREVGALGWLVRMALLGSIAAAVYKELQLPPERRTWHGKLFNVVPYDFRIPDPARVVRAWWYPRSPKVFTEQPFGVGWAINVPTAIRRLQRIRGRSG